MAAIKAYRPSSAVGKYLHGFLFNVLRIRLLVWFCVRWSLLRKLLLRKGGRVVEFVMWTL